MITNKMINKILKYMLVFCIFVYTLSAIVRLIEIIEIAFNR